MLHIPEVLNKQKVAELRQQIQQASVWVNGIQSAGQQAQQIKNNLQKYKNGFGGKLPKTLHVS